jgi:indoleacetamide hydrolase
MNKIYRKIVLILFILSSIQAIDADSICPTELTATKLSKAIRKGDLSSTEINRAFLRRIKKLNPLINAYISLDRSLTLKAALSADRRLENLTHVPLLFGVPIAVKDDFDVIGFPTTEGTQNYANTPFIAFRDSPAVGRLRQAGAVFLGKNNLHELTYGYTNINFVWGAVRNPYNLDLISGGSSGGSAAAVAARLAPVSLGSDSGGSVRVPAALNGIIGFRPTINRYPLGLLNTTTTPGILARDMQDIDLVDKVLTLNETRKNQKPGRLSCLRLGVPLNPFYNNLEPEVSRLVEQALDSLKQRGVTLVVTPGLAEITSEQLHRIYSGLSYESPNDLQYALNYDARGISFEQLYALVLSPDVKQTVKTIEDAGLDGLLELYRQTLPIRANLQELYRNYFHTHQLDGIIFPTTKLSARPIATSVFNVELNGQTVSNAVYGDNCLLASVIGAPGLSYPIGLTKDGLPVGIEVDGLPNQDLQIIRIGYALQKVFYPKGLNNELRPPLIDQ